MVYLVNNLDVSMLVYNLDGCNNGGAFPFIQKVSAADIAQMYRNRQWSDQLDDTHASKSARASIIKELKNTRVNGVLKTYIKQGRLPMVCLPRYFSVEDRIIVVKENEDHDLEWYLIRP